MLPFLPAKRIVSVIRASKPEPKLDSASVLNESADTLLKSVTARDTNGIVAAIRAMFQVLDMEPHEEGPHEDTDDAA